jgi:hypothetical protein
VAENTPSSEGKISKLWDEKSSFYGILPIVIVCTQKKNSCSLSKQDSFSIEENVENGWLHIAPKMIFGI